MREVCEAVQRIAPTDMPVLIVGQADTGKSAVANAIHECSHRKSAAFTAVDCAGKDAASLTAELFGTSSGKKSDALIAITNGGTLFLENIDAAPLDFQHELVIRLMASDSSDADRTRAIVAVRLIFATTHDPEQLLREGKLDSDLRQRLRSMQISIKPLKDRRRDVLPLTRYFLRAALDAEPKMDCGVAIALIQYAWPRNIIELIEVLEYAVEHSAEGDITIEDLPPQIGELAVRAGSTAGADPGRAKELKEFLRRKMS